jgi:hypothetical protein
MNDLKIAKYLEAIQSSQTTEAIQIASIRVTQKGKK